MSHILGRERSHGTGLEQLIEASRLREASVAAEQRQLAREKERLETKVWRDESISMFFSVDDRVWWHVVLFRFVSETVLVH